MKRRADCPSCERESPFENHGWTCTRGPGCIEQGHKPKEIRIAPMTKDELIAKLREPSELERIAGAIESAQKMVSRDFCLLDYSNYEGTAPPHVVKAHGKVMLRTENKSEARELYDRLIRQWIGRAALEAIDLPRIIAAAKQEERERCAKVIQGFDMSEVFGAVGSRCQDNIAAALLAAKEGREMNYDLAQLRAVLADVESATEPSRELDFALHQIEMGEWLAENGYVRVGDGYKTATPPISGASHCCGPENFTASIDAAVGLIERVLPGWFWSIAPGIEACNGHGPYWAELYDCEFEIGCNNIANDPNMYGGKTPALALCAALLRTLIAIEETRASDADNAGER